MFTYQDTWLQLNLPIATSTFATVGGCDHFATTRLDQLNYASQVAAAGDLGGIEAVRKR